ncbi:hypothetical protein chiPu_0028752, partial [Chiloscyllium punctatum]|nr:hypothetical protein [Chiloscyllium punctatum]
MLWFALRRAPALRKHFAKIDSPLRYRQEQQRVIPLPGPAEHSQDGRVAGSASREQRG